MLNRTADVPPARTGSRSDTPFAVGRLALGLAAAAMLAAGLGGCNDHQSDTAPGRKPSGSSTPASGSGSWPSRSSG